MRYLCGLYLCKMMSNTGCYTYPCINKYLEILNRKGSKNVGLLVDCIHEMNQFEDKIIAKDSYNTYNVNYETTYTSIPVDMELGKKLQEIKNPNILLNSLIEKDNIVPFFTDGSKIENGSATGYAIFCPNLGVDRVSCNKNMSVFSAECAALDKVLSLIKENSITNDAAVFTDSLSSLMSLNSIGIKVKNNPFIISLKQKYTKILKDNPNNIIKFFWINSHSGIDGNEAADRLAKKATISEHTEINKIPFTDLKEFL